MRLSTCRLLPCVRKLILELTRLVLLAVEITLGSLLQQKKEKRREKKGQVRKG